MSNNTEFKNVYQTTQSSVWCVYRSLRAAVESVLVKTLSQPIEIRSQMEQSQFTTARILSLLSLGEGMIVRWLSYCASGIFSSIF